MGGNTSRNRFFADENFDDQIFYEQHFPLGFCCPPAWACPPRTPRSAPTPPRTAASTPPPPPPPPPSPTPVIPRLDAGVVENKRPLEGEEPVPDLRQKARRHTDDKLLRLIDLKTFEVDGSQFLDRYDHNAFDVTDPKNHEVIVLDALYKQSMKQVVDATKDEIDWAPNDKTHFLAKDPLGQLTAHYPPIKETGKVTNVAFNVHQRVTAEYAGGDDGTPPLALKMKAVCLQFQSMAIADLTHDYSDHNECTRFKIRLDGGAVVMVPVHNSHAALLHYDIFEKWPCCNVNNVDIEKTVKKRLGASFLKEVDELFAELIQARRIQVATGGRPVTPVLVWNRGTMDGREFRGAQVDTFKALQAKCGKENVFSTYHMAFLMNKSYAGVKIAARYADEATYNFVQSTIHRGKGKLKGSSRIPDGFWSRYHEVADMTDAQRAEMLKVYSEFMKDLGERGGTIVKAAWTAVKHDREHETSTATADQIEMVRRMEEGSRVVSDAWAAVKFDREHETSFATADQIEMVRLMEEGVKEGGRVVSDACAAVKFDLEYNMSTATPIQIEMVRLMEEGVKKGGRVVSVACAAVKFDLENGTSTATPIQIEMVRLMKGGEKKGGEKSAKATSIMMDEINSGNPGVKIKAWYDKKIVDGAKGAPAKALKFGQTLKSTVNVTVEDSLGCIVANFIGTLGYGTGDRDDPSVVFVRFQNVAAKNTLKALKERGHDLIKSLGVNTGITLRSSPIDDKVSLRECVLWPESRKVLLVGVKTHRRSFRVIEQFDGYRFYVYGGALLSPVIQDLSDDELPNSGATGATATSPHSSITMENQLEITSVPVDNPTDALDPTDVSSTTAGPPVSKPSSEIVAADRINFVAQLLHSRGGKKMKKAKEILKEYGCSTKEGNFGTLVRRIACFVEVHNQHLEKGSGMARRIGQGAANKIVDP